MNNKTIERSRNEEWKTTQKIEEMKNGDKNNTKN